MWGVPIDHEYFEATNDTQWLWYYYNQMKDEDEAVLLNRELIEYHAGFVAPDVVDEVRKRRAADKGGRKSDVTDDGERGLMAGLERLFGRTPEIGDKKYEFTQQELEGLDPVVESLSQEQFDEVTRFEPMLNHKHWLNFNLE